MKIVIGRVAKSASQMASSTHKPGRTRVAFGLVACIVFCAPSIGRAQFSVSPVILTLPRDADQGASIGLVSIRNEGEKSLEFRLLAFDFDQSSEGNHVFLPSGSHPSSCGDDVRITPDALAVGPGQSQQVRFEVLIANVDLAGAALLDVGCGLGDLWKRRCIEYRDRPQGFVGHRRQ